MASPAFDVDQVLKSLASQSIKQGSDVRAAVRSLTLKALQQRELTLDQMLAMQALYQKYWADNSVSFTANVDPDRYLAGDIADTLQQFAGKIKGSTIFPEMSFKQAPYERLTREEYEAATTHSVGDGVNEECATGACPIR